LTDRPSLPSKSYGPGLRSESTNEARTRGEFRAQSLWMLAGNAPSGDAPSGKADAGDAGEDTELAQILSAIAEDVQRKAATVSRAVLADYAGKIAHARKHLPRHQLAGAVRAYAEARTAALAVIKQAAASELTARRKAAILRHRGLLRALRAAQSSPRQKSLAPSNQMKNP